MLELDPDPNEMNADPQPWKLATKRTTFNYRFAKFYKFFVKKVRSGLGAQKDADCGSDPDPKLK